MHSVNSLRLNGGPAPLHRKIFTAFKDFLKSFFICNVNPSLHDLGELNLHIPENVLVKYNLTPRDE